ncbi:MAG: hypothetical protein KAT00_15320, partial [Planctomycetes bacterium]|nr:hypothetical protein [Planctomycetota bacterium]
ETETRIHNLRRELARRVWDARNSRIESVLEVDGDLRELVCLCPADIQKAADELYHKYKTKIFTIIQFKKIGMESKNHAIRSREILGAVRLPANMVG